jgi:hypothetical protein
MAAANGQVLMTWVRNDTGTLSYRYAVVQGTSAAADVRTLGTGIASSDARALSPTLSSGVAALQWSGPIFSQVLPGPLTDTLPRGVTLDAGWNARRSSAGNLNGELLPSGWAGSSQPLLMSALGDRLVVASFAGLLQIPELPGPSDFVLASFLQPGTAALASAAGGAIALANKSGTLTNIDQFGQPRFLLQWPDRALVIGDNASRTMISLFWLR